VHLEQGIPSKGKTKFWAAVTSNLNSKEWKHAFPSAPAVSDKVKKEWTRMVSTRLSEVQQEAKKREAKKGNARACVGMNDGEGESGAGDVDGAAVQVPDDADELPRKKHQ
jgi:hypothetical protein